MNFVLLYMISYCLLHSVWGLEDFEGKRGKKNWGEMKGQGPSNIFSPDLERTKLLTKN